MILEFSNLIEDEEENSKIEIINNQLRKQKHLEYFLKIKRNIIDLFLVHNDLLTDGQILPKSNSETNLNKLRKNKNKKRESKNQNEIKYKNLNIEEESKINSEIKDRKIKNKNKKTKKNNVECNLYYQDSNIAFKYKEERIPLSKEKNEKILNNNEINNNNSNNEDNFFSNRKKNIINSQNINNNPLYILEEDNFSVNSSKNENSLKNSRNNYSFSSFGKNFILKNKVCKSTKNHENNLKKNKYYNYSDDNPIMTYFMGKNLGNFYLMTDKKSQEEIDNNQYLNFFPMEEKEMKNKDKDIMSCIYIDNKTQENQTEIKNEINVNKNNKKDNNEGDNIFNFKKLNKSEKGEIEGQKGEDNFLNLNINNIDNRFNNNNIKENKDNFNQKYFNNNANDKFNLNINKNINNNISKATNAIDDNKNFAKNLNDLNINLGNINLNDINLNNININDINLKDINLNNLNLTKISLENINNSNKVDENNFEFPLSKKTEKINLKINDNDIFNNININDIKLPLSLENNLNLDNTNFKEFKLNPDILKELSNLNKKISSDPNYYQFDDNCFNNNKLDNLNISNNQINFNNIDINNLNINFNNEFNINNFNENINSMNILPLNKSFYDYTDDELLEYAIPLIKDQSGCRFLQDKIKTNQNFGNEQLFPKIQNDIKELCCDPFGNYFLQVLIDTLSFDNIDKLLSLIKNDFTNICICPHGTRVIQKLIEKICSIPDLMNKFINDLNCKDLGIIFKSPYGNHIMQKFLTTIHMSKYTKFIYDYTFDNFMEIAETKHGVCVIQKCVSEGDEKQRKKIYDLILQNFDSLIKDQFGNYLIQYILINTKTKEKLKEVMPLINKIEFNLLDFCKSKYSANVIEKCFENKENYIREHILEYLLKNYKDKIIEILFKKLLN